MLKNAKTCLYGNKAADVFETNPITVIFCYCPEIKICGMLNIHPGVQQRYRMTQIVMKMGSVIADSSFLKLWSK